MLRKLVLAIDSISTETLHIVAMCGAGITLTTWAALYVTRLRKLSSGEYVTVALDAICANKRALYMLGEPIKVRNLRLHDGRTRIGHETADVWIPVVGTKTKGYLHSQCSNRNGKWELDKLDLELKDHQHIYIIKDSNTSLVE